MKASKPSLNLIYTSEQNKEVLWLKFSHNGMWLVGTSCICKDNLLGQQSTNGSSTIGQEHKFDSQKFDSQKFDSQKFDSQKFDSQKFDSQKFDSQKFDSQKFDSQTIDYQIPLTGGSTIGQSTNVASTTSSWTSTVNTLAIHNW